MFRLSQTALMALIVSRVKQNVPMLPTSATTLVHDMDTPCIVRFALGNSSIVSERMRLSGSMLPHSPKLYYWG